MITKTITITAIAAIPKSTGEIGGGGGCVVGRLFWTVIVIVASAWFPALSKAVAVMSWAPLVSVVVFKV